MSDSEDPVIQHRDIGAEFHEGVRALESRGLTDIGALGSWSLSSFKPGNGVRELRQDDPFSFWQTDGALPHSLDIHFSKKVTLECISLFMDFEQDESYTPFQVAILSGTGFHDLMEVKSFNVIRPTGWSNVWFDEMGGLETFIVRIHVTANHDNGKDSHLRSVKLFAKQQDAIDVSPLGPFTSSKLLSEGLR